MGTNWSLGVLEDQQDERVPHLENFCPETFVRLFSFRIDLTIQEIAISYCTPVTSTFSTTARTIFLWNRKKLTLLSGICPWTLSVPRS